jgi:CBS domain-containing protein
MKYAVPVVEVMSKKPVTVTPDTPLDEVARTMAVRDVGSVIVISNGRAVGIVTEKDIVTKVVTKGVQPSGVMVKDIMSSPLKTVGPMTEVLEAAKLMSANKIRRLPVVQNGELVGIVTENTILRFWPSLIEVTRERARMAASATEDQEAGYCEQCGMLSDRLAPLEGRRLCPDCREEAVV